MRVIRSLRQTPALVVSIMALLIALSGTSVAVVALAKGQVKTRHLAAGAVTSGKIKNNAVKRAKIKNNAIVSGKVKDGSLLARDFRAGELPAGEQGPVGQVGPVGPVGPAGAPAVVARLSEGVATTLTPLGCYALPAGGAGNVSSAGEIYSGWLSSAAGAAVVSNGVIVIPGARNLSTQGGSIGGVMVCNQNSSPVTLPTGWKFNLVRYPLP